MAFLDHNGESEFPLPKNLVFAAMCKAIPAIKGMKIESADKLQGRIVLKSGVSLFSWGENIPIQLISVNENLTKVLITSSPKTGIMFGGAFDMGKNRKNIEQILNSTSIILSDSNTDGTLNSKSISNSNNYKSNQNFMENQNRKEKPFYKKTWVIIVGVILLLIIIGKIGGNDKSSSSSSSSETVRAKQWTVVYEFKGNGMKKSPVFELTGNNAKLKYKYNGDESIGSGMFAVYVVEEGKDIMVEGGIPEVMTDAVNEDSESSIQKGAGRYYLNVNASGKWSVTVEEEK